MGFLPRRRGQSFGGFGRKRSGFRVVKKGITTSYITSAPIAIAATVAPNYSLLINSDSPVKSTISDLGANIAQCENNSRIQKKGSFIQLNMIASTVPVMVGIWVYLNSKGMVVAPVNSSDFNQAPTTLANAQLREYTIFYRQVPLSTSEYRTIRIPLGSRRLNYMADPASILVMVIHNKDTVGSLTFSSFGRIRTIEG